LSDACNLHPPHIPLEHKLKFDGTERTYFILLPEEFDPDSTYWPLVFVHGGGGNARTNPKAIAMRRVADEMNLSVILIIPEFITIDKQVSRFPSIGEGAFLEAVLGNARTEFNLHEKILLTGYSMGGQFSHRFALTHPSMVKACAAFAAGTWSTADGRLLIEGLGEVKDPKAFLSDRNNASKVPGRLHDIFDARTAQVAGLSPSEGAQEVPFLIMCGTLDPRYEIAVVFASSLRENGFTVETAWPKTPHSSESDDYRFEFGKFSEAAIRFFLKHINDAI
jgi:pimeloyl-ACP methyl ester carboxylesterase